MDYGTQKLKYVYPTTKRATCANTAHWFIFNNCHLLVNVWYSHNKEIQTNWLCVWYGRSNLLKCLFSVLGHFLNVPFRQPTIKSFQITRTSLNNGLVTARWQNDIASFALTMSSGKFVISTVSNIWGGWGTFGIWAKMKNMKIILKIQS